MNLSTCWFRLQGLLCVLLFLLIVLGAGVRLADAGLACPDWPLCHGDIVPTFNFQIFMEWIHRAIAMTLGFISLATSIRIFTKPNLRKHLGVLAIISLILFGIQAFLGRQTVILLLKAETVASHLAGGYLLFAVNLAIWSRWKNILKPQVAIDYPKCLKIFGHSMLGIVYLQAILGALVSSHYAGNVCGGFPKCQDQWWPIPFEGPIAIHMFHRMGALTVLVLSFSLLVYTLKLMKKSENFKRVHKLAKGAFIVVVLQWGVGISMIFTSVHPGYSLIHSFFALSIFSMYLLLTFQLRKVRG